MKHRELKEKRTIAATNSTKTKKRKQHVIVELKNTIVGELLVILLTINNLSKYASKLMSQMLSGQSLKSDSINNLILDQTLKVLVKTFKFFKILSSIGLDITFFLLFGIIKIVKSSN